MNFINNLYLSMLLLVIFFGRDQSAQLMLEFSGAKQNLRIMSDMESDFGAFWFQMVSLVFLFLTPSFSSLETQVGATSCVFLCFFLHHPGEFQEYNQIFSFVKGQSFGLAGEEGK